MDASKGKASLEQSLEAAIRDMAGIRLDSLPESGFIDTPAAVSALVDILYAQPSKPPSLYFDVEGVNLSRQGSVSILQVFVRPTGQAYLIDVYTLNDKAFTTRGKRGHSLKDILEAPLTPKVFFDVRNDSDALFAHFRIRLAGIQDLQLMEMATRRYPRRVVSGLAKCMENDAQMSAAARAEWQATKEKGRWLFSPEYGGSYELFNERPLDEDIRLYCTQDVQFLPQLWDHYDALLSQTWRRRVLAASKDRVALSQSPNYNGHGRHMTMAPENWAGLV